MTASTERALELEYAGAVSHVPEVAGNIIQPIQRQNVVVVQYVGHRAGLVVDNLLGGPDRHPASGQRLRRGGGHQRFHHSRIGGRRH
ncbi:MAG TPA: hypothetical protein VFW68_00875 [Rhodocyclaceae bacterium]|nr:hypothetical protein [Rhodocyclaceae bacterium]